MEGKSPGDIPVNNPAVGQGIKLGSGAAHGKLRSIENVDLIDFLRGCGGYSVADSVFKYLVIQQFPFFLL